MYGIPQGGKISNGKLNLNLYSIRNQQDILYPHGKFAGRIVTYGRILCKIRPQKSETHCTRLTVGGNLINFPGDFTTPTVYLTTAKIVFNSVLLTKN